MSRNVFEMSDNDRKRYIAQRVICNGDRIADVARAYGCHPNTVRRYMDLYTEGKLEPTAEERIARLENQLRRTRGYFAAVAIEQKVVDNTPNGYASTPREILTEIDNLLGA